MSTETHTTAGRSASARVAPVGAVARAAAYASTLGLRACHGHQSSTWTPAVIAPTTSFMVVNGKNRPTRPLSERSP